MGERHELKLTKTEAKQIYKSLIMVEDTKAKLPKKFWERHEVLIDKLSKIIYKNK